MLKKAIHLIPKMKKANLRKLTTKTERIGSSGTSCQWKSWLFLWRNLRGWCKTYGRTKGSSKLLRNPLLKISGPPTWTNLRRSIAENGFLMIYSSNRPQHPTRTGIVKPAKRLKSHPPMRKKPRCQYKIIGKLWITSRPKLFRILSLPTGQSPRPNPKI